MKAKAGKVRIRSASKQEKPKKKIISRKGMTAIYISVIAVSVVAIVTLFFVTLGQMKENARKKEELLELQKQFEEIATRHENLNDEDYAELYFKGDTIYIPSDRIIIQYQP